MSEAQLAVRTLLRRRAARRASQRGAAVFIVVMAIVLLTGIGVFAVRTASMVDVAAGYDRQAMQTYHLSELAGRAIAADLSGGGEVARMMLDTRNLTPENCLANRNPTTGTTATNVVCYRVRHGTIDQSIGKAFTGRTLVSTPDATNDGSFGPRLGAANTFSTPLEGQILLEITDPNEKGEQPGSADELEVTVTAHAQIRPSGVGDRPWCAPEAASMGASVQLLRAHIDVPMPPRPKQ
jgi:hypothetical protein